jgi:hypothetical protein
MHFYEIVERAKLNSVIELFLMDGVKKTAQRLVLPRKDGQGFLSVSLREEEYARRSAEPSNSRGIAHP